MSDRGVSDLLGFVLMFTVIIGSVALIGTAGVAQLSDLSEREAVASSTESMSHFAGSLNDLDRHGELHRTATLSLGGGTLWINDSAQLSVDIDEFPSDDDVETVDVDVDALEHRFQRSNGVASVVYEAGAVFRTDGAFARHRPSIRCRSEESVSVTVLNLSVGESLAVGGGSNPSQVIDTERVGQSIRVDSTESTIEFDARFNDTTVEFSSADSTSYNVSLNVENTVDPEQWEWHFEDTTWTKSGDEYTCEDVETVLVRTVTVDLSANY